MMKSTPGDGIPFAAAHVVYLDIVAGDGHRGGHDGGVGHVVHRDEVDSDGLHRLQAVDHAQHAAQSYLEREMKSAVPIFT